MRKQAVVGFGAVLLGVIVTSQIYASPTEVVTQARTSTATVADPSTLTPTELQVRAEDMHTRTTSHAQHAHQLRRVADASRDALASGCVAERASTCDRVLAVSSDGLTSLRSAVHSNDKAGALAQYKRIADVTELCDEYSEGIDSCAVTTSVVISTPTVTSNSTITKRPRVIDNPTDDCNVLGLGNCELQPLEYVAFASPFTPGH